MSGIGNAETSSHQARFPDTGVVRLDQGSMHPEAMAEAEPCARGLQPSANADFDAAALRFRRRVVPLVERMVATVESGMVKSKWVKNKSHDGADRIPDGRHLAHCHHHNSIKWADKTSSWM